MKPVQEFLNLNINSQIRFLAVCFKVIHTVMDHVFTWTMPQRSKTAN